jgi:hypothetical protein
LLDDLSLNLGSINPHVMSRLALRLLSIISIRIVCNGGTP